eukprot:GFKZ01013192.1.p1 GENE.GFKZ01013192.1~~GFKZ01013192.1.p1  ORF type:complete len:416 (-),score=39.22 GFKZ01013192.1:905-2152(-)
MNTGLPPGDSRKGFSGYGLSPTPYWMFWLNLFSFCALLLYLALGIVSDIRAFLFQQQRDVNRNRTSSDALKTEAAEERRHDKSQKLEDWLAHPSFESDSYDYMYPSRRSRIEVVLSMAIYGAFTKVATKLVRSDRNPKGTAIKLRSVVKTIRQRAEASEKFRECFENLLQLLRDIEASSAASISSFVRQRSTDMARHGNEWYIRFAHRRTNSTYVSQPLYETTLATFALFHAQGSGFEAYYMNGHWKEMDRSVYGALTMLEFFVFDKCAPPESSQLVGNAGNGLEQILLVDRRLEFKRVMGYISSADEAFTKNLLMWDITRNYCNEFVESSWSVACLERVVWTLEHGLNHLNMELYESVKEQNGQRRVDMTQLNALSLMTLSVAGLLWLEGIGSGAYQMVGSPNAKVRVHGRCRA